MPPLRALARRIGITSAILATLTATAGTLFLQCNPVFGGTASTAQLEEYANTGHFRDGVFINPEPIDMQVDCHSLGKMLEEMLSPDPDIAPSADVPVKQVDPKQLNSLQPEQARVTWLGHSSFLVEIAGLVLLLDPVFGSYPSPIPVPGRARYSRERAIQLEDIERIDAVLISHDHYDHLEYSTIEALRGRVTAFFVPLGVGNHLRRWQVPENAIHELDWWQEQSFQGLRVAFTPSRHMSGRGFSDQSATLWGSWVLKSEHASIFFSGDGGYGRHFAEIGKKYGPFDLGLIECGQYNELWRDVHMMPEQTVLAARDTQSKLMVPIHWGAFSLAAHAWTEPVERALVAAEQHGQNVATPRIGESITVGHVPQPSSRWWRSIPSAAESN